MTHSASPPVVVAISATATGCTALGRLLRARDYRLRTARPGGHAARALVAPPPDAIILDADPHDASVAALLRGLDTGAELRAPIIRLDGSGRRSAAAEGCAFRCGGTGSPLPRGFDIQAQQGTGLRVVSDLVCQYGGSFTLRPRRGGTEAVVRLGAVAPRLHPLGPDDGGAVRQARAGSRTG